VAPLAVYLALAAAFISARPGPSNDETLFQAGAVHLLTSTGLPSFTHSGHGWVNIGGRWWPLMMMPYAGAVSFYLLWPVFTLFGPELVVGRVVAALLGAFGLWSVARLLALGAGAAGGAAVGLVLAVHPGYLSHTVFNDSGVAYWMGALGALCLALRAYLQRATPARAALVGLACGLGVWTRLNFTWLAAALALGAAAGVGRRLRVPAAHAAAMTGGALLGAAPLVWYQFRSAGRDTLGFMASFGAARRTSAQAVARVRDLLGALLYDSEHRGGLWQGPTNLPFWQALFVCAVVSWAVVAAFRGGGDDRVRRWHRAAAIAFLCLAAVMMWPRLPIRGHHLVTLVPLAAAMVVLAARRLPRRPGHAAGLALAAALYACAALDWNRAARRGLVETGGAGMWSDAVVSVARYLDTRGAPHVAACDWGFHNSVFVLTRGRVRARELFWHPPGSPGEPVWREEIVPGGVYVTHAPPYLYPIGRPATQRFQKALARSGLGYSRLVFHDRRGLPHTELVEVQRAP
jgi:4-amino-4-deoxy-L-arabinose transferase-like glycosyltransferase